jgi:SAM-dependent methyltransferase
MMNLKERYDTVVREHGAWSAHNLEYAPGLFTIGPPSAGQELRLRRVVQVILDAIGERPIERVRILDLACLEGLYALEFASRGAQVVAIEGRSANVAKALFVRNALGLANLEILCDDVRNLSVEKYGQFDVVLCAGILYHIDAPDVFHFLRRIREVTTQVAFFDTHVARKTSVEIAFDGTPYAGEWFQEYAPDTDAEEKKKLVWAALENHRSFWFSKGSLVEAFSRSGFTTVAEVHAPLYAPELPDRQMFLAWTGQPVVPVLAPWVSSSQALDYKAAMTPDRALLLHEVTTLRSAIGAMEQSRFWKMRNLLVRIKRWARVASM